MHARRREEAFMCRCVGTYLPRCLPSSPMLPVGPPITVARDPAVASRPGTTSPSRERLGRTPRPKQPVRRIFHNARRVCCLRARNGVSLEDEAGGHTAESVAWDVVNGAPPAAAETKPRPAATSNTRTHTQPRHPSTHPSSRLPRISPPTHLVSAMALLFPSGASVY